MSDAIIAHNRSAFIDGDAQTFVTEYHKTLETVVNDQTAEVYLAVLCAQYRSEDGDVKLTGAVSGPCALTFAVTDGTYRMTEYWEPEDGGNFDRSLRGRFPEDAVESGTDVPDDAMEICGQRAAEYFEDLRN